MKEKGIGKWGMTFALSAVVMIMSLSGCGSSKSEDSVIRFKMAVADAASSA